MISGKDMFGVLTDLVPLYVAMLLAYGSVRWWKIFTPEQCSGISNFVSVFAFPILTLNFTYSKNPYNMNIRFITADALQKIVVLVVLILVHKLYTKKRYGSITSLNWVITLFSLFTLPNNLVVGIPMLKPMYGEVSEDLMVQIVLLQAIIWKTVVMVLCEFRAAKILISEQFPHTAGSIKSIRADSDVVSIGGEPLEAEAEIGDDGKLHVVVRRQSSIREASARMKNRTMSFGMMAPSRPSDLSGVDIYSIRSNSSHDHLRDLVLPGSNCTHNVASRQNGELHMFAWNNSVDNRVNVSNEVIGSKGFDQSAAVVGVVVSKMDINLDEAESEGGSVVDESGTEEHMPSAFVLIRLICVIVCRKLMRNSNTYTCILGLVWSLIAFRWNIELPKMVSGSIEILSSCGLGMSMFSLGLFMALQPKLVPCGKKVASLAMGVRFIGGPAVMAAVSAAIGIRGLLLQISIVQAALPEAIVPFVFAMEYNVHPDILSTAVIFSTMFALPIVITYYVVLGLLL